MTKKTIIVLSADSCFDVEPTTKIVELHANLCRQFGSHYRFAIERYDIHNWRIVGYFGDDDTLHWSCESITLYARGYIEGIVAARKMENERL